MERNSKSLIVLLLLLLAGIGGIAYANRKAVISTAAADKAKLEGAAKAEDAKMDDFLKKL